VAMGLVTADPLKAADRPGRKSRRTLRSGTRPAAEGRVVTRVAITAIPFTGLIDARCKFTV